MKKNAILSSVFVCAIVFFAIFVALYFNGVIATPDTIDVTRTHGFNFFERNYNSIYYDNNGIARAITYLGEDARSIKLSPLRDKLGFYHDKPGDERAGKDMVLEIMDTKTKEITTVYEGSYKTSAWDWINNDRVIVYYNCGSPCYAFTIVSTEGEVLHEMSMHGLSYKLSPDKQWLLGFVDWAQTLGVTVMNIETKKEYELVQANISSYQYGKYAQAVWSPDSRKLAVLNKHSDSQHLAATVYDVVNNFQILHQETITCELIGDDLQCNLNESAEIFLGRVLADAEL